MAHRPGVHRAPCSGGGPVGRQLPQLPQLLPQVVHDCRRGGPALQSGGSAWGKECRAAGVGRPPDQLAVRHARCSVSSAASAARRGAALAGHGRVDAPGCRVLAPAAPHEGRQRGRAVGRHGRAVPVLRHLHDHLHGVPTLVRLAAGGQAPHCERRRAEDGGGWREPRACGSAGRGRRRHGSERERSHAAARRVRSQPAGPATVTAARGPGSPMRPKL